MLFRVTFYCLLAWVTPSLAASPTEPKAPPNVVIFFADDLGYGDLGSYGHPYIRTPNLDTLAAEGQRWTDFYAAAPVCTPSRGALLTGRLPVRTGLYGKQIGVFFPNAETGMPAAETTLAEALKQAGYATGIIGKWHLGDAPQYLPTRHGFDYWYGVPYSNDMDWAGELNFDELIMLSQTQGPEAVQTAVADRRRKYFAPEVRFWNVPLMRSESATDGYADAIVERPADQPNMTKRHTDEALKFIDSHRQQPFFLYVPYSMPHTPIFRSDAFSGRSLGGRYGDVIEELDWSVGAIVEKLKALELDSNTLVVFTSDNGPWLTMNQHGGTAGLLRHGKGTTFEGGMRVPGIFWWPGAIRPGVVSDIGSTLDLFATVLNLAGLENTTGVDGYDLSPTLQAGAPSARRHVAYYRSGELRAYRLGDYKLHLVTEGAYGQPPERAEHEPGQLYNLKNDPAEKFDVAADYPAVVAAIRAAVKDHQAAVPVQAPLCDHRLAKLATGG